MTAVAGVGVVDEERVLEVGGHLFSWAHSSRFRDSWQNIHSI
jgi:hypothetical protein